MEINDDHIVELIKGQAATAQAVLDLKGSVEKGFTFIHSEQKELETRVGGVEKKVWYSFGVGSTLGIVAGVVTGLFHK